MRDLVAERAAHGETWHVLVFHPYARRPEVLSLVAFDRLHAAVHVDNALVLDRQRRLVVVAERLDAHDAVTRAVRVHDSARVASIGTERDVSVKQHRTQSRSATQMSACQSRTYLS